MKGLQVILVALLLSSCSLTPKVLDSVNPFKEDSKGLEVQATAQIGKENTSNSSKDKSLAKVELDSQTTIQSGDTVNEADQITNIENYGTDQKLLIILIILLCLASGMAIPTRGQAKLIKHLKEELEYERYHRELQATSKTFEKDSTS